MGALIKSLAVESDTLLLGPGSAVRSVSAQKIEAEAHPLPPSSVISSIAPPIPVAESPSAASTAEVDAATLEESMYRRIMSEHEAQLESLRNQALEEAYAAGYAEGERNGLAIGVEKGMEKGSEEGRAAYSEAVSALEQVIQAGRETLAGELDRSEPVIAEIVFQSVCKIVGETLHTPEGVYAVVANALANAKRSEIMGLKLAPRDMELLLEHAQRLGSDFERLQALGLEADDSVELGGCIVQLKGGYIDGRIETQFRAFAQSLKDAAQGRG